jgi:serine/threonine-protein kinase HipA
LTYRSSIQASGQDVSRSLSLEDIIKSDELDLFNRLLEMFLNRTALAGIQPKVLATLKGKSLLGYEDFIIKTWSAEFPNLAENEYFCMRCARKAGLVVPKFYLSADKKLFIIERFDKTDNFFGFE